MDYKQLDTIEKKIHYMEGLIDLESFIKDDITKTGVASYYKSNHFAYKRFHDKNGFMHFHVSQTGTFSENDAYYQSNKISEYIKPGNKVVELGCGQCADICYLATKHPDVTFMAFDLSPLKPKELPSNLQIFQQDYSKLTQLEDNSIDLVYAVETLVHNKNKDDILKELHRILKPEGVLVVYDFALIKKFDLYNKEEQMAIALISKGGAGELIESLEEWDSHFASNSFKTVEENDLTKNTLPDLQRLEKKANRIMAHPLRIKILFRVLPKMFVSNIILGYLGYNFAKNDVGLYMEWILRK